MVEATNFGPHFKRARLDAARRLDTRFEERSYAAAQMGCSDSFLKKVESGEKRPSLDTLEDMASAYGCHVGDLFPSQTPRGPEADAILGPLLVLPPDSRGRVITQISAFARMIASEADYIATARASQIAEASANNFYTVAERDEDHASHVQEGGYADNSSENLRKEGIANLTSHLTGRANHLPAATVPANEPNQRSMGSKRGRQGGAK